MSLLKKIQELNDVPDSVKAEIHRLSSALESALESPKTTSENISFYITAYDSSVINALGSGTFNSNQQLQPTKIVQQQKKDIDPTLESEHYRDEESEEEDKIPSDLSIQAYYTKLVCRIRLGQTFKTDERHVEQIGYQRSYKT